MSVVVTSGPEPVLTLDECKAHLRVDWEEDDDLIEALARAAEQHLASPFGPYGSIGLQDIQFRPDWNACDYLPCGPVREILDVVYRDAAGSPQVLPATVYDLVDGGTMSARLGLKPGQSWPFRVAQASGLVVNYRAGYAPADVPGPLRTAMLLLVGHWYANREAVSDRSLMPVPMAVDALCAPYRIWSV